MRVDTVIGALVLWSATCAAARWMEVQSHWTVAATYLSGSLALLLSLRGSDD